jgi:hypothetical protein
MQKEDPGEYQIWIYIRLLVFNRRTDALGQPALIALVSSGQLKPRPLSLVYLYVAVLFYYIRIVLVIIALLLSFFLYQLVINIMVIEQLVEPLKLLIPLDINSQYLVDNFRPVLETTAIATPFLNLVLDLPRLNRYLASIIQKTIGSNITSSFYMAIQIPC